MPLNKQKGNMYAFVTHTWNPIRGRCPHDCSYCYMKVYPQGDFRFVEKELGTNLGQGNFIFVGSSTDMWVKEAPQLWIKRTLEHCFNYAYNRYLFQSKDPARFRNFEFPDDAVLGTTIESNRHYTEISKAPPPYYRAEVMKLLSRTKMISMEPIMDFDLETLIDWVRDIKPEFVSIGADSKGHNLPEPSADKLQTLIEALNDITIVKLKDNLKRLLGQ